MAKFWRRQKNKKEKLLDIVKIVFGQVLNVEEWNSSACKG
jgi:hypothetical protein